MTDAEFIDILNAISECFINDDFATWETKILRPFTMITRTGPICLTTLEELEENFNLFIKARDNMNVDLISRRAITIDKCEDGIYIGTYETQLLSRGQRLAEPYISSALFHASSTGWRMSSILGARGHHSETGLGATHWEE